MENCQNQCSGMDVVASLQTDAQQTTNVSGKARRKRTIYSRDQSQILNASFKGNLYPGFLARQRLAELTCLEESRIQVWFQNRRARLRNESRQELENLPLQLFQGAHVPQESSTYNPKKNVNSVIPAKKHNINYLGDDPGHSYTANMNNLNGMNCQNTFFSKGRVFQDLTLSSAYVNQAQRCMYDHQFNYLPSNENIQGTSGYTHASFGYPAQPPQGRNECCSVLKLVDDFPAILSQGAENCPGNIEDVLNLDL